MGLSIQDHARTMRRAFPGFRIAKNPNGIVFWEGDIIPPGKSYRVMVACRVGRTATGTEEILGRPYVKILSPAPRRREEAPEEEIPHLEYPGRPGFRSLCLYDENGNEWNSDVPITEMVPWISEWLLCYEIWHATGKWTCG